MFSFAGDDLHFFAAIQFTEEIPSAQSTLQPTADPEYLAAWGRSTHGAMVQADPEAVWVLDGARSYTSVQSAAPLLTSHVAG